jgi:ribosome maturation factor RimP
LGSTQTFCADAVIRTGAAGGDAGRQVPEVQAGTRVPMRVPVALRQWSNDRGRNQGPLPVAKNGLQKPIFFSLRFVEHRPNVTAVQAVIERTVTGMGYDLVDVELAGGGLLRVFIDVAGERAQRGEFIRVEDCERVSHQLNHLLTVEEVDYARLEVSSPGLDRPLKKPADFERFEGAEVTVRLRQPLKGRRNFEGVLVRDEAGDGRWALEMSPPPPKARGGKAAKPAKAGRIVEPASDEPQGDSGAGEVVTRLTFTLDEIERARLVPKLKF